MSTQEDYESNVYVVQKRSWTSYLDHLATTPHFKVQPHSEVFRDTSNRHRIYDRDKGICYLCGDLVDPTDFHIDHFIPISRGGPNSEENLRLTHPICNSVKSDRMPSAMQRFSWHMTLKS